MESLLEQVQRALVMEQNNTTAVNELKAAVTSLRDVIGELGANAAAQAEALRGIREVFTREVGQLRDEQGDLAKAQQSTVEANRRSEDLLAEKVEVRIKGLEGRVSTVENNASRSRGYWEGSKYILGVVLMAVGGIVTMVIEHVKFN